MELFGDFDTRANGKITHVLRSLWNSRLIVAIRFASEIYGIWGMLLAILGFPLIPSTMVLVIAFIRYAEPRVAIFIGLSGYILAIAIVFLLFQYLPAVRNQIKDKDLKERCFEVAKKLYSFAEERDNVAPPQFTPNFSDGFIEAVKKAAVDQSNHARTAFDDETRQQYAELYGSEVGVLLDSLEDRDWIKVEKRKRLENQMKTFFTLQEPTENIREIAQYLERIGNKI